MTVSILLYGCTTWTLKWWKSQMGNTPDVPFWKNPENNSLESSSCTATYLPSHHPSKMSNTYKGLVENKDKFISDILLWISTHGHANVDQSAKIYIYQLCADTGCSLEALPRAIDDRDGWEGQGTLCSQHNLVMLINFLSEVLR